MRKSIEKIRSSPQRRESFRRQCNVLDLDVELTQDVKTRWNTTYDMIIRALKLRQVRIIMPTTPIKLFIERL